MVVNEKTSGLKAAFAYIAISGAMLLGILLLVGCQTRPPVSPDDLKFPPVKYPPIPKSTTRFIRPSIPFYTYPVSVKLEWDYPESSNMIFRIYETRFDSNGWILAGQTAKCVWTQPIAGLFSGFYTVTASNTLSCLESDPAGRE